MLWNPINRWPLKLTCLFTLMTMLVIGTLPALAAADTFTASTSFPFDLVLFIPCANGGAGELVLLQGTLHIQQHITINNNRATIKSHFQPQGADGVGLTTGDSYNAVGVTQEVDTIALTGGATEFTFINNFRLIGQGPDNNLQVHQLVHVTINANGTVTNVIDNSSVECN